jgi:hypothetical protein
MFADSLNQVILDLLYNSKRLLSITQMCGMKSQPFPKKFSSLKRPNAIVQVLLTE